jgi:hypothetical protein
MSHQHPAVRLFYLCLGSQLNTSYYMSVLAIGDDFKTTVSKALTSLVDFVSRAMKQEDSGF